MHIDAKVYATLRIISTDPNIGADINLLHFE